MTTDRGPHRSRDNGESWEHFELPSPWQYTRAVIPRPDNKGVMFITNGSGPPGSDGRLWRSRDSGRTWEDAGLPGPINSTVWWVAVNAADPMLLFVLHQSWPDVSLNRRRRDLGETQARVRGNPHYACGGPPPPRNRIPHPSWRRPLGYAPPRIRYARKMNTAAVAAASIYGGRGRHIQQSWLAAKVSVRACWQHARLRRTRDSAPHREIDVSAVTAAWIHLHL